MNKLEQNRKILISSAAGFAGYYLSKKSLDLNRKVIRINNLSDY